mmetsp:Transcript_41533/g.99529  ORF Transcript_41533/g.99529 Transcript_41533/m.99529 type:complete len:84 (+) Transcript_41533:2442-2693(+)
MPPAKRPLSVAAFEDDGDGDGDEMSFHVTNPTHNFSILSFRRRRKTQTRPPSSPSLLLNSISSVRSNNIKQQWASSTISNLTL